MEAFLNIGVTELNCVGRNHGVPCASNTQMTTWEQRFLKKSREFKTCTRFHPTSSGNKAPVGSHLGGVVILDILAVSAELPGPAEELDCGHRRPTRLGSKQELTWVHILMTPFP